MNRRRSLLIAATLTLAALPLALLAQPRERSGPRQGPADPATHIAHLAALLDLTTEQQQAIGDLFTANEAARDAAFAALGEAREALHEAVRATPIDEAAIRERATAVGSAEGEAALLHARIHQQVIAVLTAEQAAKLEELHAERGPGGPFAGPGFGRHGGCDRGGRGVGGHGFRWHR